MTGVQTCALPIYVAERLRLLHDVAASLTTGVEGDQFQARIVVPL